MRTCSGSTRFDKDVLVDVVEMFGLVDSSDPEYSSLERRVKQWEVSGKSMRLAKTGTNDKFWFKLCSKMVHPTAWSINVLLSSSCTDFYRLQLGSYALKCAIRAFCSLTALPLPTYITS